jgi:hypothetical protein
MAILAVICRMGNSSLRVARPLAREREVNIFFQKNYNLSLERMGRSDDILK